MKQVNGIDVHQHDTTSNWGYARTMT